MSVEAPVLYLTVVAVGVVLVHLTPYVSLQPVMLHFATTAGVQGPATSFRLVQRVLMIIFVLPLGRIPFLFLKS